MLFEQCPEELRQVTDSLYHSACSSCLAWTLISDGLGIPNTLFHHPDFFSNLKNLLVSKTASLSTEEKTK